jgi:hypothetical protein
MLFLYCNPEAFLYNYSLLNPSPTSSAVPKAIPNQLHCSLGTSDFLSPKRSGKVFSVAICRTLCKLLEPLDVLKRRQ